MESNTIIRVLDDATEVFVPAASFFTDQLEEGAASEAAAVASAAAAAISETNAASSALAASTSASGASGSAASASTSAGNAATSAADAEAAETAVIAAIAGAGGTLSAVTLNASTRTALKALDTSLGLPAILTEVGRGGVFEVRPLSAYSALATADTTGAMVLASTFDGSKCWVRQGLEDLRPEWFGAVGDDSTNDGPAFTAMENFRIAARKAGTEYGYSYGSLPVRLGPSRAYFLSTTTWNIYVTINIETPNGSGPSGLSAVLRFADATSGVIFHSDVSTGVTGFTTSRGYSAVGSRARGLAVVGGFSGTESEHHGIQMRTKVTLEDPWADNFPGDGIYADSFSWDGVHDDNINGSSVLRPFVRGNRSGIYFNFNDANAISVINPQMFSNRRYGIWHKDNYGGPITGGNSATNGVVAGFPTQVFNNGHVFGCLPGQETWCSTNSPPSTAISNTGWYYRYDTGAATSQVPQWVSGTAYRSGAPIRIDGGSTQGGVAWHENETDQMPFLCVNGSKALILGGANFGIVAITETGGPYGGCIAADSFGIYTGSVQPNTPNASIVGHPAHRYEHFYGNNVDVSVWYYVNGAAVLGPPRTGWTADTGTAKRTANATYSPGSTLTFSASYVQSEHTALATRLAAVEAAVRDATQTQKAIKDDAMGHGFFTT